jgi:hypothetical protein
MRWQQLWFLLLLVVPLAFYDLPSPATHPE